MGVRGDYGAGQSRILFGGIKPQFFSFGAAKITDSWTPSSLIKLDPIDFCFMNISWAHNSKRARPEMPLVGVRYETLAMSQHLLSSSFGRLCCSLLLLLWFKPFECFSPSSLGRPFFSFFPWGGRPPQPLSFIYLLSWWWKYTTWIKGLNFVNHGQASFFLSWFFGTQRRV